VLVNGQNLQIPGLLHTCISGQHSILEQAKEHEAYKTWTKTPGGTLYLLGDPDSTSSILPSLLATETKTLRAISFFFDSSDDRRGGAHQMLASLSYQLLCLKPSLFDHVSRLYDLISDESDWRVEKLCIFFRSLLSCPSHGQTLCLISRVDECKPGRGSLSGQFPDWIVSLSNSGGPKNKFIITSRKALAGSLPSMTIDVNKDIEEFWQKDFESFLETQISAMIIRRPGLSAIRNDIKKSISLKHERSLLNGVSTDKIIRLMLVLLMVLSDSITKSQAKQALELLPANEGDIYLELLARIPPPSRKWARNCLSWIVRAFRPLRLSELAVALVIETNEFPASEIDGRISLDLGWDLKRVLGDLVQIENGEVRSAEMSLREFLTSQHHACEEVCLLCCDSHAVIAKKCLTYISLLRHGQGKSLQPPPPVEGCYGLLAYAVQYWHLHYHEVEREGAGESHSNFDLWFEDGDLMQVWCDLRNSYQVDVDEARSIDPISTAAEIGCRGLLQKLCDTFRGKNDLTVPLELAIQSGDEHLIGILTGFGATSPRALHIAASYGHDHLVQTFKTEENLISENARGFTPLQCACESGSVSTVEELLRAGSKANAANERGLTPLHIASQFGQLDIISKLLLVEDVDPKAPDASKSTPLHMACRWQQPGSVRYLLRTNKRVDLCAVDEHLFTALHHVADSGRVDILDLLLEGYPDSLIQDEDRKEVKALLAMKDIKDSIPLHLAARGGHAEVVTQLLSLDDPEDPGTLKRNSDESIPLHLAVENGHLHVANLLVEHELTVRKQIEHRDRVGLPISLAVRCEHVGVVSVLCAAHRKENTSLDVFDVDGASPLHVASRNGNIEIARLLLDAGATPDIVDSTNATPLLLACRTGFVNFVGLLLKKDANPRIEDENGVSPIMAAAQNGNDKLVEMLLEKLTDEDLAVAEPQDPHLLHLASERGHLAVVQVLLRNNSGQVHDKDAAGRTPLHLASAAGHLQVVHELLRYKANPVSGDNDGATPLWSASTDEVAQALWSAREKLDGVDLDELRDETLRQSIIKGHLGLAVELLGPGPGVDGSLLHLAAQNGHLNVVNRLAELVGDPDGKDDNDRTPLSYAAQNGHLEVVQFLVEEKKANVNSIDNQNRSPLSHAAEDGQQSVVDYLLRNGTLDPDPKDTYNRSPLWYASRRGHAEAVRSLLRCKVDRGTRDQIHGWTPLHAAAYDGHIEVIEELLTAQADKDALDDDRKTPLYLAAYWGYKEVVSKLIAHRAKSDLPNAQGWRPLHAAYDDPDILELLLDEPSADLHWKTNKGETVLHLAVGGGIESSVKFLLGRGANPLSLDHEDVTPLHIAAKAESGDLVRLMLPGAIRLAGENDITLDKLKDRSGSSPFMQALGKGNIDVVREFIMENAADINQVNADGKTPLEVAMNARNDEITKLLLDRIVAFDPSTIPDLVEHCDILVWVIEKGETGLEGKILEILQGQGKPPTDDQVSRLFSFATGRDDVPLAEYLVRGRPDLEKTDEHGWTLQQIIAAYKPETRREKPSSSQAALAKPKFWSSANKAEELSFVGEDGRSLRYTIRTRSWFTWAAAARADHPIDPSKKFYFEIEVIDGGDDR